MVIVPDRLSALVDKGEVTERYYNPGDLFERVDIVLVNDDRPDPTAIQPMVGSAELRIHNLPETPGLFRKSGLWRPRLLRRWAAGAVDLARELEPQLIRCHGAHLNSFAASEIGRQLGVPYVVSMHINPDADIRANARREGGTDWRARLQLWASIGIERASLRGASAVVGVYRFIVPYAERMGAKRIEVIYNVVCPGGTRAKTDYAIASRPRVVVPGRQIPPKDPTPVLEAVAQLPEIDLTLIGDGSMHDALRERAEQLGIADRTEFVRAVPNDALCLNLRDYDALISVNDYGGVSKVELESSLVGMPVITNRHPAEDEPELLGQNCITVDGDAESYRAALERLLGDAELRERLGTGLREAAAAIHPERMEQAYVDLYRELALPA
jgi:glycosyltransferase involved in cell wall biosynthesis